MPIDIIIALIALGLIALWIAPMPVKVTYREPKVTKWGGGEAIWKVFKNEVNIHPKYKEDTGLLMHELYHVRGSYLENWCRSALYKYSDKFKYLEEIGAYREQLKHYPETRTVELVTLFSRYIQNNYKLPFDMTQDAVERLCK